MNPPIPTDCGCIPQLGVEKEMAILFSDITGYTPFAESLSPQEVIRVLDGYYKQMGNIIRSNGGHLIDYFGDGFLAVFGLSQCAGSTWQAVQAAWQIEEAMLTFNWSIKGLYPDSLGVRIGVHYGKVIAGWVGAPSMQKLAVIGDAVNLASRIERANKSLGTQLLLSQNAYQQVSQQVGIRASYQVDIAGKKGQYLLYEPQSHPLANQRVMPAQWLTPVHPESV